MHVGGSSFGKGLRHALAAAECCLCNKYLDESKEDEEPTKEAWQILYSSISINSCAL